MMFAVTDRRPQGSPETVALGMLMQASLQYAHTPTDTYLVNPADILSKRHNLKPARQSPGRLSSCSSYQYKTNSDQLLHQDLYVFCFLCSTRPTSMSGAPISTAAPGADQPNENTGPKILAVVTTITMIALVTVALRIWVRLTIIRRFVSSDYAMVLAMILATTVWVLVVLQVKNGAGRHAAYLEPEIMMRGLRANFATQPLTLIACTMPKVSVALFLLPIATRKLYRYFLWGLLVFMFVYTSVAVITTCLQCTDLRTFWDPLVPPNCWSMRARQTLSLVYTSLTIATDFTLAFVPIPMLWNVQINFRVKLSLIAIMSMGIFAASASIVKATTIHNFGKTGDFLWDSAEITIWVALEINVGIIAGCLPCLKPLFKKILTLTSFYSSSRSPRDGNRSGGKEMHSLHGFTRRRAHASFHSGQQKMTRSKTTVSSRGLDDHISEEGVLPIQGGPPGSGEYQITKTTVVTIDSVRSGVQDEREQGLHSGQETDWPIR
ncbi:hypothetical protein QTJ16_006805 [Diplocarpon rosae]|uniref:Rhodopsin domain-containing protein n=1 Tax=Diplocarpon rosae TaxID=946125 RepID=A0AAD9SV17_9HELO|nr:hypothetical protein QTJ16_006805 [Diplocarpon rosae]